MVGQVTIVLLAIGTRHEHVYVAAEHFVGAVTEEARCGRVERLHETVAIDDDDALCGGFDE